MIKGFKLEASMNMHDACSIMIGILIISSASLCDNVN